MIQKICLNCSRWDVTDEQRKDAKLIGGCFPCKKHSPARFNEYETCIYFDEVQKK